MDVKGAYAKKLVENIPFFGRKVEKIAELFCIRPKCALKATKKAEKD